MTLKICTVLGARPQFIKASVISNLIKQNYSDKITEILIHTGQHFDRNMSNIFFEELKMPNPSYRLNIHGGSHAQMVSRMMLDLETTFQQEKPDMILVYGDTNSTLAGALVASQMGIPLVHVEAGLRSYNSKMPEERNRVLTDHLSDLLFCPTKNAQKNLEKENLHKGVFFVGDVMLDLINKVNVTSEKLNVLKNGLSFSFMTLHRAESCKDADTFNSMVSWIGDHYDTETLIWAAHPRARDCIERFNTDTKSIKIIQPLGYFDTIALLREAECVFTDSGGLQKEAFFVNTPCVTLRDETEWVETIDAGANILWKDYEKGHMFKSRNTEDANPFGNGNASEEILKHILNHFYY